MLSAATPSTSPSVVQRAEEVGIDVWNVASWPEEDLAADLGWDIAALTGLIIGFKFLLIGLHHEHKARPFFTHR